MIQRFPWLRRAFKTAPRWPVRAPRRRSSHSVSPELSTNWGQRETEARAASVLFNRRGIVLGLAHAAAFSALTARLYQLQVLESGEHGALAFDNRTRQIPIFPERGRILDAAGRIVVANREHFQILIVPDRAFELVSLRALLANLAPLLSLSPDDQDRLLTKARRQGRHLPLIVTNTASFEAVAILQLNAATLPGVSVLPLWSRLYPNLGPALPQAVGVAIAVDKAAPPARDPVSPKLSVPALSVPALFAHEAMAHIIGTVGAIERRALDDDPAVRLAQARVGKTGVEAGMEAELRGVAGQTQIEVDARGRQVRILGQVAAIPGHDVRVTVDTALQMQVMERLARDGRPSAAVIMNCNTGDIAALASTPTYDPSVLTTTPSGSAWQTMSANRDHPLLNRAIAGQYPPGSTFKMVTALAALEAGVLTVTEKIECWGDLTVAGHTFRCWNRRGHIASDLHKALRESCDCYFYEAARRVGMDKIASMAGELGLGQTFDAGLSRQKSGLIPTPAWKRNRSKTGWLIGETILSGIGQGYVLTTPLQLAVMTARLATGRAVTPTVIARPTGDPAPEFRALALSPAHLAAVRRGMIAVVNEVGGTGQSADIDDGKTITAGKTGTSQVSRASAERDPTVILKTQQRDHALFVGYFPASAPRFAISAVLEHAGGGGAMAAPLVRDLTKLLLAHEASLAKPAVRPLPLPAETLPPVGTISRADAG